MTHTSLFISTPVKNTPITKPQPNGYFTLTSSAHRPRSHSPDYGPAERRLRPSPHVLALCMIPLDYAVLLVAKTDPVCCFRDVVGRRCDVEGRRRHATRACMLIG